MTLGTITQLTNAPEDALRFELKMERLARKGLEQQVIQLRELLATKTNVCEMQYKLIRLLESQRDADQ